MTLGQHELAGLAVRIREAIREELRVSSRGLPFRAWDVSRTGGFLNLALEPEGRHSVLDESLEDGRMAWEGESPGSAELISVVPAASAVNALLITGRPPKDGTLVYINPPRYLEALLALWEQDALAAALVTWFFELAENSIVWNKTVAADRFSGLRAAQIESFSLIRWRTSFLWGPPGTGKTHTLGRLLSSYLVDHPGERVLLLASTNVAVDLAILAVDDALNEMRPNARPVCYRFGSRFDPQRFRDRKHLTPLRDKTLVEKLRLHYEAIPDPAEAEPYHHWKRQRDRLREAIRNENLEFLSSARLVAMTTTLAAHDYSNIGRFDLVVFDEASQVGKAQAMTFAHLGSRVLYAGDPNQLAPIAQAGSPDVTTWLAASPFAWKDRAAVAPAVCMLDEQWRMAQPISKAVSEIFYESKLRVATPAASDRNWIQSRTPKATKLLGAENVVLIDAQAAPVPAHKFRGYECAESAKLVSAVVVDHVLSWSISDIKAEILVLTPYRAQRRRIEAELRAVQAPQSLASTVHRAQGSERLVVIFDPVCPTADFVAGEEGMRLVNVAFSRAKCRLIVMLQSGWENHRAISHLARTHPPVVVNRAEVDRLLSMRLPSANRPPVGQAPTQTGHREGVRPARPILLTPIEDFREEIWKKVAPRASREEVQQSAREVKDKARFRTLSWREIDQVIQEILQR